MTDMEIRIACAKVLGIEFDPKNPVSEWYNPITDKAQALGLVEALGLWILGKKDGQWMVATSEPGRAAYSKSLTRAISECAALNAK